LTGPPGCRGAEPCGSPSGARQIEPVFCAARIQINWRRFPATALPTPPCAPLSHARRVFEGSGAKRARAGNGCCNTALGRLRVRYATGEAVRDSWAPHRGRSERTAPVPFHTLPEKRGALRSSGVPTLGAAVEPAASRTGETPQGAGEHPQTRCVEGFVGAWRFASPVSISHRGHPKVGEASCRTRRKGLLLGRLGSVRGAPSCAPRPLADGALGNSEEGSGWGALRGRAQATRAASPAGSSARRPSN
jgi:hypothetical protein